MKAAMTVNWRCERCGEHGKLVYDEAVPKATAYRDALRGHGLSLQYIQTQERLDHVKAVHITVPHTRAASTQQRLL